MSQLRRDSSELSVGLGRVYDIRYKQETSSILIYNSNTIPKASLTRVFYDGLTIYRCPKSVLCYVLILVIDVRRDNMFLNIVIILRYGRIVFTLKTATTLCSQI